MNAKELSDKLAASPLLSPTNGPRHVGKVLVEFDLVTEIVAFLRRQARADEQDASDA